MPHTRDLVVVGAGPAGLATALAGVRHGLRVTVVERRSAPIDKACGEGLMPGALAALQGWGVDPPGHPIRGITYRQGERCADAQFRAGTGRGVRRTTLHAALHDAAVAAGVEFLEGRAETVEQAADGVRVAGVRARYAAAADGLHSPIRRSLGLSVPAPDLRRWGTRRHYRVAAAGDRVEVLWAADSEAYLTPVTGDTVGVALLGSRQQPYDDALRAFPELRERLRNAEPVSSVRGAGPLRQRVRRRVAGRVLLVGDAAGYVDALTGEGLGAAFAAAAALVDAVRRDCPREYEWSWRRVTARSRWLTAALLAARRRPPLAGRIVPLAARAPWVFREVVHQLARG